MAYSLSLLAIERGVTQVIVTGSIQAMRVLGAQLCATPCASVNRRGKWSSCLPFQSMHLARLTDVTCQKDSGWHLRYCASEEASGVFFLTFVTQTTA
jgi:hypothetical protein